MRACFVTSCRGVATLDIMIPRLFQGYLVTQISEDSLEESLLFRNLSCLDPCGKANDRCKNFVGSEAVPAFDI